MENYFAKKTPLNKLLFLLAALAGVSVLVLIIIQLASATVTPFAAGYPAHFEGEYRIGDGEWTPYIKGKHISSLQGDVILRGSFHPDNESDMDADGMALMFMLNHIGGEVYADGQLIDVFPSELPQKDIPSCFSCWSKPVEFHTLENRLYEIRLTNPHRFGNSTAIDELLASARIVPRNALSASAPNHAMMQRVFAPMVILVVFAVFGAAIFVTLFHFSQSKLTWMLAVIFLCTYGFFRYAENLTVPPVSAVCAIGLELSHMLYGFFSTATVVHTLNNRLKKTGTMVMIILSAALFILSLYCVLAGISLYDVKLPWLIVHLLASIVLIVLCLKSIAGTSKQSIIAALPALLLCTVSQTDSIAAYAGIWRVHTATQILLLVMMVVTMVAAVFLLPSIIHKAARARELEKELEENRIALMLSQIQPHMLYNSLTAIRSLCRRDPEKAWEAIGDFAAYLRGNMDSLVNKDSIPFSSELKHIQAYLRLEKMRIGDRLKIIYDIQEEDFHLPALTIQPLVENAVKHGIYNKKDGGTVTLKTHRDGRQIVITIADTGVGFDPSAPVTHDDGHIPIGLMNVQNRLDKLMRGTLQVDSAPGAGTTVTVRFEAGGNEHHVHTGSR
ncbi:MAG: histidine kinase [Clostridia bacterium]|nr:histidine kinase [Clostridia bacterium]